MEGCHVRGCLGIRLRHVAGGFLSHGSCWRVTELTVTTHAFVTRAPSLLTSHGRVRTNHHPNVQVGAALADLDALTPPMELLDVEHLVHTRDAGAAGPSGLARRDDGGHARVTAGGAAEGADQGGDGEATTKSLCKKLYHKNVELEKENRLLRVQLGGGASLRHIGFGCSRSRWQWPRAVLACSSLPGIASIDTHTCLQRRAGARATTGGGVRAGRRGRIRSAW
jgi:hypothetical protein